MLGSEDACVHALFKQFQQYLQDKNISELVVTLGEIYSLHETQQGVLSGKTPLHLAARTQSLDIWKLILSFGGHQVNKKDLAGNSPLHYAVQFKNVPAVKCLLFAGADPNICNTEHVPPLHVAAFVGHAESLCMLLEAGANPNFSDTKNQVALHHAISGGHLEVIRQLVNRKVILEVRTKDGVTPLEAAIQLNNQIVTQMLVTNGADLTSLYDPHWNARIRDFLARQNTNIGYPNEYGFLERSAPQSPRSVSNDKYFDSLFRKCEGLRNKLGRGDIKRAKEALICGKLSMSMRANWWKFCLCIPLDEKSQVVYQGFREQTLEKSWAIQIDKDINRTLRNHSIFHERYGEGQCKLFNILRAYTNHNAQTRYTQGMSTLAAILYFILKDEFLAFGGLKSMFEKYKFNFWYANNLWGISESFVPFEKLVQRFYPRLHNKMQHMVQTELSVEHYSSLFLAAWILELFYNVLPHDLLLRAWDLVFLMGPSLIFALGIGVLHRMESALLATQAASEILEIITNAPTLTYNNEKFLKQVLSYKLTSRDLA